MSIVKQESPILKANLQKVYTFLRASCNNYDDLSFEEFLKCGDSIYYLYSTERIFTGIIACRNITLNEIPVERLKYYCKPNKELYLIRVLHFLQGTSKEDMITLVKECIADKNDGFIYYDPACPMSNTDVLLECGFSEYIIGDKITFIKEPTISK